MTDVFTSILVVCAVATGASFALAGCAREEPPPAASSVKDSAVEAPSGVTPTVLDAVVVKPGDATETGG